MHYDSRPATLFHSQRVGELMVQVVKEALDRSTCHDRSKTETPEVDVFDDFTPKLKTSTYGSDEYKGFLEAMGEGLKHHYEVNRHHPEHFDNGVNDMTLVDLIEMLADWKAATERHDDGDLAKSLEIQRERFGLSDQLVAILRNTAQHFGWLPRPKPVGLPIAHCQHLSDEGRGDPSRAGRHKPHRWFDITSADDRWCFGEDKQRV
jgi:hypothetical protein